MSNQSDDNYQFHKPVLLNEVLENLKPEDGEVYIDGTFGAGGYTRAILNAAKCKIYAFDRDKTVEKFAVKLKEKFGDRFTFIRNQFSQMEVEMTNLGVSKIDGIVLDLGVSSMQLDEMHRGFSFNSTAKLDMRMDSSSGISAYDVVNNFDENELARIIRDFGEEAKYRQIAKRIVENRASKAIHSSEDLAEIVRSVYGKAKPKKIDPATKTFQAIRIFINDELGELKQALEAAKKLLKKGGRLVVVSFHSLEDSYVKSFLREESGYNDRNYSRYQPLPDAAQDVKYNFSLTKQSSIKPSDEEIKENVRSRSSRMRVAIKN